MDSGSQFQLEKKDMMITIASHLLFVHQRAQVSVKQSFLMIIIFLIDWTQCYFFPLILNTNSVHHATEIINVVGPSGTNIRFPLLNQKVTPVNHNLWPSTFHGDPNNSGIFYFRQFRLFYQICSRLLCYTYPHIMIRTEHC